MQALASPPPPPPAPVDVEARNERVLANQGLVHQIARGFRDRGLSREDLVQAGQLGLIRAAELFDPGREIRFSTYATYWIRQAIGREIGEAGHMVRVPEWARREGMTYNRMRAERGHDAAEAMKPRGPAKARPNGRADRIRAAAKVLRASVSYFERSRFEDEFGVLAIEAEGPDDNQEDRRVVAARVDLILSVLDQRSRKVLTLRHGLDGEGVRTLKEVGRMLGLVPERIRVIQYAAESRIRREFPHLLQED